MMKFLFFSDVHGSCDSMDRLLDHVERINPACVAFMGDALSHGPRNRILSHYNPGSIALPKENHSPSFGLYAHGRLSVLDLVSSEEIMGMNLN